MADRNGKKPKQDKSKKESKDRIDSVLDADSGSTNTNTNKGK